MKSNQIQLGSLNGSLKAFRNLSHCNPLHSICYSAALIFSYLLTSHVISLGQYPSWMNALSPKDQHLVQALVQSR